MKRVGNSPAAEAYQQTITPVRQAGAAVAGQAAEAGAQASTATADETRDTVSSECRELAPAKTEATEFDAAKVDALKASIDAGTFEIDPDVVAERIIDELS